MTTRTLLCLSLAALTLAGLTLSKASGAGKPNVIIVLSDDQGYGDFSIHGNPVLKTPNLDALARQSIRVPNFHGRRRRQPTPGQPRGGVVAGRRGPRAGGPAGRFLAPGIPRWPGLVPAARLKTS